MSVPGHALTGVVNIFTQRASPSRGREGLIVSFPQAALAKTIISRQILQRSSLMRLMSVISADHKASKLDVPLAPYDSTVMSSTAVWGVDHGSPVIISIVARPGPRATNRTVFGAPAGERICP